MKSVFFIFLLLTSFVINSQQTFSSNFGDFTSIKTYSGLTVELVKSHESKVDITANNPQHVLVKNANGTLKISLKIQETFKGEVYKIKVFYNTKLEMIDANEGSEITALHIINEPNIEVKVQEGAKINLLLDVKYVSVKAISGGLIQLKGKAKTQQIETNTGGIYRGYNLISEHATASSATAGITEVSATDVLDAKVAFGGEIYYKGSPEILTIKKVVGGIIEQKRF